ncbi:MAG: S8 family serine peptidase [Bacteroidota bacterium]
MKLIIKFFALIIFLVAFINKAESAKPEFLSTKENPDVSKQSDKKVEYQIFVKGKRIHTGKYFQSKLYNIVKVAPEDYLPNAFNIKTKTRQSIGKDHKTFSSPSLANYLRELNVSNIRSITGSSKEDAMQAVQDFGIDRIYEIYYDSDKNPYDACKELMENPDIEYAVPIFKRYASFVPNDSKYSTEWHIARMLMPNAWDITKGDTNVTIAIVDSGTDWNHEDLLANIWTNPGESGLDANNRDKSTNGIDDDGNGKIDDVHGWDLIGNISYNQLFSGQYREDNDPTSKVNTHGTHTAGCASAVTNNGKGVAGVGFKCRIVPVCCAPNNIYSPGIYRGYEGIYYAATLGVDIINCSWGGPGSSPAEEDVINYAYSKGCLLVVSAGNSGDNIDDGGAFPAGYDNVLAVGATADNDVVAGFSNYGFKVGVWAPGVNILSTLPNNTYAAESGTSMSSPVTAGLCGLVKSLHPDWTSDKIMRQLRSTCDDVLSPSNPANRPLYYGRVNAYKALSYNKQGGPVIPGISITEVSIVNGEAITSYDPTVIKIKVTNHLNDASQLALNIKPQGTMIAMSKSDYLIGNLASDQSAEIEVTVQLNKANLWYSGTANFMVTYTAGGNYKDFSFISVPILLPSNNHYTRTSVFRESDYSVWYKSVSPSKDVFWSVGNGGYFQNQGGYIKLWNGQTDGKLFSGDFPYSIFAFDDQRAFIGTGPTNQKAKIYKTVDGGTNWGSVDVSVITTFVNDVHFFDNNFGVFIGDAKGTRFGFGATNNGGTSWVPISSSPLILSGENPFVTSVDWIGNNGWVGTSKGRVIRTADKGATWQVGSISKAVNVILVKFIDDRNGIAIYTETAAQSGAKLVASTTDKGNTWIPNKKNLSNDGINPIYIFKPDSSSHIYILGSLGEVMYTTDLGTTWQGILSEKDAQMYSGAYIESSTNRARIWEIGKTIGYLDFDYLPKNARKELQITSGDTLVFDSVLVNSGKIQAINLQNIGNVPVNILKVSIVPAIGVDSTEFKIFANLPNVFSPNDTRSLRIRFTPKDTGVRTATVYIYNDGLPDVFGVQLRGRGYKEPSVVLDEDVIPGSPVLEQIAPNPCTEITYLTYNLETQQQIELGIYNSLGEIVQRVFKGESPAGRNLIPVKTENLTAGIYFIQLKTGTGSYNKKFVVVK